MQTTNESIAKMCHELNRAYCEAIGDDSQMPWAEAEQRQRDSAVTGVAFVLANPDADNSASHDNWLAEKLATGWVYGPVKDTTAKTHPCCVPYEDLPVEQQVKDALFKNTVETVRGMCA